MSAPNPLHTAAPPWHTVEGTIHITIYYTRSVTCGGLRRSPRGHRGSTRCLGPVYVLFGWGGRHIILCLLALAPGARLTLPLPLPLPPLHARCTLPLALQVSHAQRRQHEGRTTHEKCDVERCKIIVEVLVHDVGGAHLRQRED